MRMFVTFHPPLSTSVSDIIIATCRKAIILYEKNRSICHAYTEECRGVKVPRQHETIASVRMINIHTAIHVWQQSWVWFELMPNIYFYFNSFLDLRITSRLSHDVILIASTTIYTYIPFTRIELCESQKK